MTEKFIFFLIFFLVTTFHVVLFNIKIDIKKAPKTKSNTQKITINLLESKIVKPKNKKIILENNNKIIRTHKYKKNINKKIKRKKTKEVETKEVETKEVETKEVETKEIETKEIETKEVENKEVENKEVETKEVENKEVETKEIEKNYLIYIRRIIKNNIKYPRRARRLKKQGIIYVSITINKDGIITKINIEKSSGSKILDKAAIKTIKNIKRFKKIPNELKRISWNIKIPMVYRLK